jgi:sedoheptulose-bisphosphatase
MAAAVSMKASAATGVVASATRPRAVPKAAAKPIVARMAQTGRVSGAQQAFKAAASAKKGFSARASRRNAVITKAAIGDSLEEFLVSATPDPKLRQLMMSMSEAIRTIAYKVRTASCAGTACVNSFGDEQLAVDMVADNLLFEALRFSHVCEYACSEEVPEPVAMNGSGFSVAFDPLDGSSIVDTNFAVGTIFGVWPGDKLVGITGRDQVAAGMGIYGPRTVFCIALKDAPGCHEFLLQDDGKWVHVKETTTIGEGKLFAPGNLRATFDNPNYERLVNFYLGEKYTLRYTGGMVPDVFQIIVKEKGVFTNVTSPSTKAKLRILFEVAPLGLLVEKAGGASSADGKAISALDVPITGYDQRTEICYGSIGEVRRFEEYLYGESKRFAEVSA